MHERSSDQEEEQTRQQAREEERPPLKVTDCRPVQLLLFQLLPDLQILHQAALPLHLQNVVKHGANAGCWCASVAQAADVYGSLTRLKLLLLTNGLKLRFIRTSVHLWAGFPPNAIWPQLRQDSDAHVEANNLKSLECITTARKDVAAKSNAAFYRLVAKFMVEGPNQSSAAAELHGWRRRWLLLSHLVF